MILYEGCSPIRCKKNWYFKSAYFKKRIRLPVEVKPLALQSKPTKKITREEGAVVG